VSEVLPGVRRVTASAELEVRFPEVDAQGVVWHGNYLRYLELGRAAVLALGGLRASEVMRQGYAAPIVECDVRYRTPLRLEERARVEADLLWEGVPRFDFEYRVVRLRDGAIAATATTRQVLLDAKGELLLVLPPLLVEWERRCGLGR
jgi:acyl-CoA thioester hydrolase